MAKKGGLGRGLDALFIEESSSPSGAVSVAIADIVPNKNQPRKDFSEEALAELAESVKKYGVLQPIMVKPMPDTTYKIIAGERRYRAAMLAGLTEVPVIIRELDDREVSEVALIENLQREDLNAVEEALGYKNLQETYGLTQDEIASAVGKSRSAVANSMRLLALPEKVVEMLRNGDLSGGHARALLTIENEDELIKTAEKLVESGASVRDAEKLANAVANAANGKKSKNTAKRVPSLFVETELALKEATGRRVSVSGSLKKGKLTVEFYSEEELRDLAKLLSGEKK